MSLWLFPDIDILRSSKCQKKGFWANTMSLNLNVQKTTLRHLKCPLTSSGHFCNCLVFVEMSWTHLGVEPSRQKKPVEAHGSMWMGRLAWPLGRLMWLLGWLMCAQRSVDAASPKVDCCGPWCGPCFGTRVRAHAPSKSLLFGSTSVHSGRTLLIPSTVGITSRSELPICPPQQNIYPRTMLNTRWERWIRWNLFTFATTLYTLRMWLAKPTQTLKQPWMRVNTNNHFFECCRQTFLRHFSQHTRQTTQRHFSDI